MKKTNIYSMPLSVFLIFGGIIVICAYLNIVPTQMLGAFAVLSVIGIVSWGNWVTVCPFGGIILVAVHCWFSSVQDC